MRIRINLFILSFLFNAVFAQIYPDVKKRGTPITSFDQIQGDWTCIMADRFIEMEMPPSDVHLSNYRIKKDSIWTFEYPCKYYNLVVSNTDSTLKNMRFLNDTLVILVEGTGTDGYYFYKRDTFDQKIINTLIKDTIYLPSLYGRWYLQTQDCMDYSGEPPWRVIYPVYMPPIYKLDKTDRVNRRIITVNVNGTLRKFKIHKWSLKECYIELESYGWAQEKFRVKYFNRLRTTDDCGNKIIYR